MIRIEVTSEVKPRTAPKRPDNQVCWAYTFTSEGKAKPHPEECFLPLWDGQSPLAAGMYILTPQSVKVGRYGDLELAPKLTPVAGGREGAK